LQLLLISFTGGVKGLSHASDLDEGVVLAQHKFGSLRIQVRYERVRGVHIVAPVVRFLDRSHLIAEVD